MSEFEGCYVLVDGDPTFWLMEDGERRAMASAEEMLGNGLRQVVYVKVEVLESIPIKGKGKAKGEAFTGQAYLNGKPSSTISASNSEEEEG